MIYDPQIEVTCDREGCQESVFIQLDYVYKTYSGRTGRYNTDDEAIEEKLIERGWQVVEGKHYCSVECGEGRNQ